MKWITRARPKTDRIACPWLIAKFIDPDAEILYAPAGQVLDAAAIAARSSLVNLGQVSTEHPIPTNTLAQAGGRRRLPRERIAERAA